jgi:hypothetical protein
LRTLRRIFSPAGEMAPHSLAIVLGEIGKLLAELIPLGLR